LGYGEKKYGSLMKGRCVLSRGNVNNMKVFYIDKSIFKIIEISDNSIYKKMIFYKEINNKCDKKH